MPWYAIRTVYHFGVKSDGTNVFEERVVSFNARDWTQAHEKARAESLDYAKDRHFPFHPKRSGCEQDGAPLVDGYELWSELFESRLSLEAFYAERYARDVYHPE